MFFGRANLDASIQRARRSFLDAAALPENYIIFITENNYVGQGKPFYKEDLLRDGSLSLERIAVIAKVPLEQVRQISQKLAEPVC
ncbi:MAG: hypothetical protein K6G18_13290 [Treponema sp.]|nr:hypothetical protein [Treponema sp.]